jgi:hypothetical protein
VAYATIAMLLVFTAGAGKACTCRPTRGDSANFQHSVHGAVLRGGRVPVELVDLRFGLLPYLPPDVGVRSSFFWTSIGAFVGGVWMILVGTLAAAFSPTRSFRSRCRPRRRGVARTRHALLAVAYLGC